jgi:hypothetical protein
MPQPRKTVSYGDCRQVLDQAIQAEDGLIVHFAARGKAFYFRQRLNTFRQIQRRENAKIYGEGHPMHAQSPYDKLTFDIIETSKGFGVKVVHTDKLEFDIQLIEK